MTTNFALKQTFLICGSSHSRKLPADLRAIDLDQSSFWLFVHRHGMTPSDELPPGKDEPSLKASRLEEARRMIEEYAAELREIIKTLRKRLN